MSCETKFSGTVVEAIKEAVDRLYEEVDQVVEEGERRMDFDPIESVDASVFIPIDGLTKQELEMIKFEFKFERINIYDEGSDTRNDVPFVKGISFSEHADRAIHGKGVSYAGPSYQLPIRKWSFDTVVELDEMPDLCNFNTTISIC